MAKFNVRIPSIQVDAENEKDALVKASEYLKELLEYNYVQNHGKAELVDEKKGKTIIWEGLVNGFKTGRYYKVVADKVLYSDDMQRWQKSNMAIEQFHYMGKIQLK